MAGPIVCGVDFSEPSKSALALATVLARRLGRPLVAVSALDSVVAQAAHAVHLSQGLEARIGIELERLTREVILAGSPMPTRRVEVGPAARTLVDVAAEERASLIVIATQGLREGDGTWLGSTTQRVLRTTGVPVLAVPPGALPSAPDPETLPFGRLICGLDFGDASQEAFRVGVGLGRELSMPLLAIHAVEGGPLPGILAELAEEANRRRMVEARDRVSVATAAGGAPGIDVDIQAGDIESVLQERVNEAGRPPALLVVGLGGNDPGVRIGTTALRLLARTRAPILCVPLAPVTTSSGSPEAR